MLKILSPLLVVSLFVGGSANATDYFDYHDDMVKAKEEAESVEEFKRYVKRKTKEWYSDNELSSSNRGDLGVTAILFEAYLIEKFAKLKANNEVVPGNRTVG